MNNERGVLKDVILNCIIYLSRHAFPVIGFLYISRILLPNGVGMVNFANSITTYFAIFANLGTSAYAIRRIPKIRDNEYELAKFVKEMLILNLIAIGISLAVYLTFITLSESLVPYRGLLLVNSSMIILNGLSFDWLYYGIQKVKHLTFSNCFIQSVALFVLFIFVKNDSDIMKYNLIYIVAQYGCSIINVLCSRKYVDYKIKCKISILPHIKPELRLLITSTVRGVNIIIDTTIIGLLLSDKDVGLYTAAYKFIMIIITLLISGMGLILTTRASYIISTHEENQYRLFVSRYYKIMMMLAIPACVGSIICAKDFIQLFAGPSFTLAVNLMKILSFCVPLMGISGMINTLILQPLENDYPMLIATGIGVVINIIGDSLVISYVGVSGVAVVTLISELIVVIILYLCTGAKWYNVFFDKAIFKYILASLLIIPCCIIVKTLIPILILRVIISIILSITIYIICLYLLRDQELLQLIRVISCNGEKH